MKIVVVGCGRLGAELVTRLYTGKHEISVVDNYSSAFNNLPADFTGLTVQGDALRQDILIRAGIEDADALAAVTNSDELNVVVAHIARKVYHVPNVVVRNFDPTWKKVHESFGVHFVSSTTWGAQRIEEMLHQTEIHTVFSAGNGEVEIYEFCVPALKSTHQLSEIMNLDECIVASVTRAGRALFPNKNLLLEEGDVIHISATFDGIRNVRHWFHGAKEA